MPDHNPPAPLLRVRSPLTGQLAGCPRTAGEDPAAWVRAIAAGLAAAGLIVRLDDPQHHRAASVTVTARPPGRREADVILDEDGYAELHWWPGPSATPAEVTAVITRVMAAVVAPAPATWPIGHGQQPGSSR